VFEELPQQPGFSAGPLEDDCMYTLIREILFNSTDQLYVYSHILFLMLDYYFTFYLKSLY
jgi:hypothetical protein